MCCRCYVGGVDGGGGCDLEYFDQLKDIIKIFLS